MRFLHASPAAKSFVSAAGLLPVPALAGYSFASIDGGTIDLDDYKGKPVLVVNTASLCGFVESAVASGTSITTDDWSGYASLGKRGALA